MKTCALIAAYNEAEAIAGLVHKLKAFGIDVIVADDGSKDNTVELARGAGAVVLENKVNSGKGASLIRGFNHALENGFEAVVTLDGDGQHLPQDVPLFLALARDTSIDMIVGNRMWQTGQMPYTRVLTNKFMSWLISGIIKNKIPDTQCGFRLIKRQVLEKVKLQTTKYEIESELLIKASRAGFKISSVPINSVYAGQSSKINPLTDTLRFIKFIFSQL